MTLVIMLWSFAQMVCGKPLTTAKNAPAAKARQMVKCERNVIRIGGLSVQAKRKKTVTPGHELQISAMDDDEVCCRAEVDGQPARTSMRSAASQYITAAP